MKIFTEQSLRDFHFWSRGADRANLLTGEQLDEVEDILKDMYPDGVDETTINDLFWFDFDTIKEWLGISIDKNAIEDVIDEYGNEFVFENGVRVELSVYEAANGTLYLSGEYTYTDEDGDESIESEDVEIDTDKDSAEEAFEDALEDLKAEIQRYI